MIGIAAIALVVLLVVAAAYWIRNRAPGAAQTVTMQTIKGDITIEVYPDKMPVTVANFEKLVKSNIDIDAKKRSLAYPTGFSSILQKTCS